MAYAENTKVPIERSKAEIEKTLTRYGAQGFAYGWQEEMAVVRFVIADRQVRFILPLPPLSEFARDGRNRLRGKEAQQIAWEQGCRQRWRALALAIKAKLEVVESGIATFEDEFLAHIMLPNGETAGNWMKPQIAQAYQSGKMPPLLGYGGA